jgi:predicted esterase
VRSLIELLAAQGVPSDKVALVGFSQGACLSLEFIARNAQRYAAVIGLSGGLIGPPGTQFTYQGSLAGTPVLLGCSDIDAHIPVDRVYESAAALSALGAVIDTRIYPGMGHTVNVDEVNAARMLLAEAYPNVSLA